MLEEAEPFFLLIVAAVCWVGVGLLNMNEIAFRFLFLPNFFFYGKNVKYGLVRPLIGRRFQNNGNLRFTIPTKFFLGAFVVRFGSFLRLNHRISVIKLGSD